MLRNVGAAVSKKGMQGLEAHDEADSINRLVFGLIAQGANAIVAVVHQGGQTPERFNQPDCCQLSSDMSMLRSAWTPPLTC